MSQGWENGTFSAFRCPLCGSKQYVEVRVRKPSGHWYVTEFYKCFHCSVMFKDPVLFTQCREDVRNADRTMGGAHTMGRPQKKS